MSKRYLTSFCASYCDHWTASQAVSELVSNYLDSDGEGEFHFEEDAITLTNKNIIVSNRMLVAGLSDKKGCADKRGVFGVGSIQAMVVLTALGLDLTIHNGSFIWKPEFTHSDDFDMELFSVLETIGEITSDFTVNISGLDEEVISEVKQRCLEFQEDRVLYSTEIGDILEGEEGEIFIGDMFVTQDSSFKYSYNFNPDVAPTTQDRNMMDPWELKKLTAKMISLVDDEDFVKDAIEADTYDTQLVHERFYTGKQYSNQTHAAVDAFAKEYLEEHRGYIVTDDYTTHREYEDNKVPSVYIQNRVKVKAIQESSLYQESIEDIEIAEKMTPFEVTESIVEDIKEVLDNKVAAETANEIKKYLDFLLEKSEDWEGDIVYDGSPF